MSTGPDNLYQLAVSLLDAIVAFYTSEGVNLPATRYVTGSEPAADCESLAVTWGQVATGLVGPVEVTQRVTRALTRTAHLAVYLFRCIPTVGGQASGLVGPSVADLDTSAQTIMTDAYELHRGIVAAHYAGTFGGFCNGLQVGPVVPIQPQGGIGGSACPVIAELG